VVHDANDAVVLQDLLGIWRGIRRRLGFTAILKKLNATSDCVPQELRKGKY